MEILQLKNTLFINTPNGAFIVNTTNKTIKTINADSFNLVANLIALQSDIKSIV